MMIPTNPEVRRIVENAHAERSAVVKTMLASLFTRPVKAPKGVQPAAT